MNAAAIAAECENRGFCILRAGFPVGHGQIVLSLTNHAAQLLGGHIFIHHNGISQQHVLDTFITVFVVDQAQHPFFFHRLIAPEEILCHIQSPTGEPGAILAAANERITVLGAHHIVEGLVLLKTVAVANTGIFIAVEVEELKAAAIATECEDTAGGCIFKGIACIHHKILLHRNAGPLDHVTNRSFRNRQRHQFLRGVNSFRYNDIIAQLIIIAAFHPALKAVTLQNGGNTVIFRKAVTHGFTNSTQCTDTIVILGNQSAIRLFCLYGKHSILIHQINIDLTFRLSLCRRRFLPGTACKQQDCNRKNTNQYFFHFHCFFLLTHRGIPLTSCIVPKGQFPGFEIRIITGITFIIQACSH